MPIDPAFQKERPRAGKEKGVAIWGPVNPPRQLGIRGTHVAVDWDICTGCGACLEVCPQQLYEWIETPDHPNSERKPFPARELECLQCYRCENECSVRAIRVVFPGPTGLLDAAMFPVMLVVVVGGIIYGIMYGPALGLGALFWIGWGVLALALPLFLSIAICFRRRGKPGEGKSFMDTTVLVDSGTYAVVRHPQLLGGILMMVASILISQHWLAAILGIAAIAWWYVGGVQEEAGLMVKFGDEYRDYMQRVPRMNLLLGAFRLLMRRK